MTDRSYYLRPLEEWSTYRRTGATHALHVGGQGRCSIYEIEYASFACDDNEYMELLGKHWVATGESLITSHRKPIEQIEREIADA